MMETAFAADFNWMIPTALQPLSMKIAEALENLSTSSSVTDHRFFYLKLEVQTSKDQLASADIIQIEHTERLDQLNKT